MASSKFLAAAALLTFQILASVVGTEVCYEPCGCFNDDPPFHLRPLPESPEEQEIEWRLYTPENKDTYVLVTFNNTPAEYNPTRPTKFLIHGWGSSGNGMVSTKDAFLDNGYDYNVIIVDWSVGGGRAYYPLSASNTRVTGACSGAIAERLVRVNGGDMTGIHCIGHSLGGQTCGAMGKFTEGQLGRVTGLDPAGPWFDSNDTLVRIDSTDAQFVDIIHSNVQGAGHLGLRMAVGHVDFYPNKGGSQPGCRPLDNGCDHGKSVAYFRTSVIESAACQFTAYPCQSEEDADSGNCGTCVDDSSKNSCQKMGYYATTSPGRGIYYLTTVEDYPYCNP